MNLTISLMRNIQSARPSFKANTEKMPDENSEENNIPYNKYPNNSVNKAITLTTIYGILALAGVCFSLAAIKNGEDQKSKFADTLSEITDSDSIRKDTLIISDVTEDGIPDLVLVKKDGTKCAIDFEQKKY